MRTASRGIGIVCLSTGNSVFPTVSVDATIVEGTPRTEGKMTQNETSDEEGRATPMAGNANATDQPESEVDGSKVPPTPKTTTKKPRDVTVDFLDDQQQQQPGQDQAGSTTSPSDRAGLTGGQGLPSTGDNPDPKNAGRTETQGATSGNNTSPDGADAVDDDASASTQTSRGS